MANLLHIVQGWGKTLGLLAVSPQEHALSMERLLECSKCPHAVESKVLKAINGVFDRVGVIACSQCGCPVNEKSQVVAERCPLGKWDHIKTETKQ